MTRLTVHVPVRWSDLDPYGHVNNVAMLGLLEEARIAAFWHHGELAPQAETAMVTFVASNRVEYLAPLLHSDMPVRIDLWISALGGASIDIDYEVLDGSTVCARARTVLVAIDPATNKARRLDDNERDTWQHAQDAPLTFRR